MQDKFIQALLITISMLMYGATVYQFIKKDSLVVKILLFGPMIYGYIVAITAIFE